MAKKAPGDNVSETPNPDLADSAIDTNPHSDLPAAADISTEIPPGKRPLPFGVYSGKKHPPKFT